jgi:Uncharacterized protein conserved in bacteria
MKKRVISIFLALIMCFSLIPVNNVLAAENTSAKEGNITSLAGITQSFSDWANKDLVVGDSYGIYPAEWKNQDMKTPITQSQLMVLLSGERSKLLDTNCVKENQNPKYSLSKTMTVKKVLKTFYTLINTLEYTKDIGTKDKTYLNFMKENGIYTGKNGEQALNSTCSIEQACVIATRVITCVYDKLDASSKGFLWKTTKNGNTVYMLGSIHIADHSIYPFSKKILAAYQSADALVLELNSFDQTGYQESMAMTKYTDGTTLKDHVTKETYSNVLTAAAKYGISEQAIAMFKPWALFLTFETLAESGSNNAAELANASSLGIDMNFATDAYTTGKPILEVEGYVNQIKVIDSFSDELEAYLLNETLDVINGVKGNEVSSSIQNMEGMLKLWHDGDVENFLKTFNMNTEYPELNNTSDNDKKFIDEYIDKLFTKRDIGMADYIDNLLKSDGNKTYFVVVGSGHYISKHSVIDILKEKGYEISQIK